jgi:hypothetical protein
MTTVVEWDSVGSVNVTDIISEVLASVHYSACHLGCRSQPCEWRRKTRIFATHVATAVNSVYKLCLLPRLNNAQVTVIFRQVFVHIVRELELDDHLYDEEDESRRAFILRTVLTAVKHKFVCHPDFRGFNLSLPLPWQ